MASLSEEAKALGEVEDLRAQLTTALRQRDDYKRKREYFAKVMRDALYQAVGELKLNLPKPRRIDPRTKDWQDSTPETAILLASDWQLGKRTVDYNSEVCAERVKMLAESTIRIAQIQNQAHPVRECRLYLAGDMIEGEGIFPNQAHEIDSGTYRQVAVNGPRILSQLILDLLRWFDKVHVVGIPGNHGEVRLRMGPADPETSMDRMLYQVTRLMLSGRGFDDRLTWNIPEGRGWYAVDRVGDWGFLIAHGDQIRGHAGFPWYGYGKKAWGWIDAINEPWDWLLTGHFHTPTSMTLNLRQVRVNGSTESYNAYAQEQMAAVGHPTQWLAFAHPKRGVTAEYWVSLADKTPQTQRWKAWAGL